MPSYISLIIAVLFAVYLNFQAARYQKSRVLWTILGFLFSFIATAIFMFRTKRVWFGVFWIVVFLVVTYLNVHTLLIKMQSVQPS